MIAQTLLSLLLALVLVHGWTQYRRAPVVAALSIAAGLAGLYFVWAPAHSTSIAEFMGIGRGVDLILYLWVCISLNLLLSLHLKLRAQQETITKLARSIALANPVTAPDRPMPTVRPEQAQAALVPDGGHMSRRIRGQIA